MIKAVIFDCFGVLTTESFGVFRDKYFAGSLNKRQQANQAMDKLNSGLITVEEFEKKLAGLADVTEATVQNYLGKNMPNEPLFDYIRTDLKPKYKIGMLSNAGSDWTDKLFEARDIKLFDDIVLSYKYGYIKPSPEIYLLSAKKLGLLASECVFIDDNQRLCEGAKTVGMQAILYQDFPQMKAELEKILAPVADN